MMFVSTYNNCFGEVDNDAKAAATAGVSKTIPN